MKRVINMKEEERGGERSVLLGEEASQKSCVCVSKLFLKEEKVASALTELRRSFHHWEYENSLNCHLCTDSSEIVGAPTRLFQ